MKKKDYTLAGYVSITNAVLTLPLVFISVFMMIESGGEFSLVQTLLSVAQTGLIIYMYLSFKELLNNNYNYREINNFIDILIVGSIVMVLLDLASPIIGSALVFVAIIILGVVKVIAFVKLLNIKDDLYGHLKPLAYTSIATGVLLASVLLIGLAFIPSIISDIVLGMIFFKASK